MTPPPRQKVPPADARLRFGRAQPPGRGGCRCLPNPPVKDRRTGPGRPGTRPTSGKPRTASPMVPTPGTLRPRMTPPPRQKVPPADARLRFGRAQPPGRGGCRCLPNPPVKDRRTGPGRPGTRPTSGKPRTASPMVPTPGTLRPRMTPPPRQKVPPADARLRFGRAQPPGRGGCRCRPGPPVENPRTGPGRPGTRPTLGKPGTASPMAPTPRTLRPRQTPWPQVERPLPRHTAYNTRVNGKFAIEGDAGRPDGAAAEGPARPGQTEDGGSDGAHAGDPPPPDDPVLGENAPPGGPPAPSPAASRSAGQNRLQNPGMAGGRLGSAGGALSARCVEIRRSESPANSRVG
ncbi:basic proline-rich protein-like [Lytechinus variegatus]|uniref:basic proline-rich protein-like n=1 Tax=Lytechinus variegatus TaxID=7654 RepID=UPI001BB2301E|nr:basic proline-rich protein-like [Lytechinus variegatus]